MEAKRSHFLGSVSRVRSEDEAQCFISAVKKQERDARHHCFAYRLGTGSALTERQSDDGEPQGTAGKPMLELLQNGCFTDICVVVSRYFGGTLLGTGGLLRAYTASAKAALDSSVSRKLEHGTVAEIMFGYQDVSKVMRCSNEHDVWIMNEDYGEKCCFRLMIPSSAVKSFADDIINLTNGRTIPDKYKEVLYYKENRPILYREL